METGIEAEGGKALRRFKRLRKISDVVKAVRERDYPLETTSFDQGGDWISFGTPIGVPGKADFGYTFLNTVSGRFFVKNSRGTVVATESSGLDGVPWFDEVLRMVYEPFPPEAGRAEGKGAPACAGQGRR